MTAGVLERVPDSITQTTLRRRGLKRGAMFAIALLIAAGVAWYVDHW